jgi:hypothetical protein
VRADTTDRFAADRPGFSLIFFRENPCSISYESGTMYH